MVTDPRRFLPSVDSLLLEEPFRRLQDRFGRDRVVGCVRAVMDHARAALVHGGETGDTAAPTSWAAKVLAALEAEDVPSLRPVINATGVVLHTNLGRAPLADVARAAMARVAEGYSNLEFDLEGGTRGSR